MIDAMAQFHFLRPWALLIVLSGLLLFPFQRWLRGRRDALGRIIAPHLLPYLCLGSNPSQRLQPVHGFSALLIIGGLAASGPTWEKAMPPFVDDQTHVTAILDVSEAMGGNTLALGQNRIQALAERHPGWHIGLIAYGQSAHRVLPASRDTNLLSLYLNSLEPGMVPGTGRNLAAALAIVASSETDGKEPSTVIVVTDSPVLSRRDRSGTLPGSAMDLLFLTPANALSSAAWGSTLDILSAEGKPFSSREADLQWLESRIQSHYTSHQSLDEDLKWRDFGYWLIWPALLIALFSIRKGWRLQWCLLALALLSAVPPQALAGTVADAFLTGDQQGRLAFESGRYGDAAKHFQDPYLKGLSAYHASDFQTAVDQFRRLDTAQAWFYLANSYARQVKFEKAIVAYKTALERKADFPEAAANLALALQLSESLDQGRERAPDIGADELRFDKKSDSGLQTELQANTGMTDAIWLQNLSRSATGFLRRKFAAEQRAAQWAQP